MKDIWAAIKAKNKDIMSMNIALKPRINKNVS